MKTDEPFTGPFRVRDGTGIVEDVTGAKLFNWGSAAHAQWGCNRLNAPSLRQALLAMLPSDWDQQSMPGFAREMIEVLRKAEL